MRFLLLFALITSFHIHAQDIKVEFDKNRDFSKYHTYRFGGSEIITPSDQKLVEDKVMKKWIQQAVEAELASKGLRQSDTADLVVTYVAGSFQQNEVQALGPLGLQPGSDPNRVWSREFQRGNLVIDLNESNGNLMVWRVNANYNFAPDRGESLIEQIVERGFKKFGGNRKKKK
ncbi:MAG: DUF4136 domain-containing protein [Cyclobacteriaceae bacterium]|nr:DUF4136 domain-containing protein [Cyclobacteriaceae bacterium]